MTSSNPYRGFRYPAEVIKHAVWLYHCFSLSSRDLELILAARGIEVSYESIRDWGFRFGRLFANALKQRRPCPGDKWHLDEVFVRFRGKLHYVWRRVDQNGHVFDVRVQTRRDAGAARRFLRKLLRGLQYVPRVIVTDRRRGKTRDAVRCRASPEPLPQQSAEASHQPTRRRERQMQRFQSARQAQRFLFRPQSYPQPVPALPSPPYRRQHRAARDHAYCTWRELAGVAAAARTWCPLQAAGDALTLT